VNILLFGAGGQVGRALRRALAPLGTVTALTRADREPEVWGDLAEPEGVSRTIRRLRPDVVVNAAAYTAVDRAEEERALAFRVNAEAVEAIARACADVGAWLVHYSTDYVFDGSGASPRREGDPVDPLNAYGESKLAGEQALARGLDRHLIFRTSWVYAATGANFLRTMLRLAGERDALQVVDDQIGAPTGADLIADVTAHALRSVVPADAQGQAGIYHLVARGETSWHDYARRVIERARAGGRPIAVSADAIRPVPTTAFPTPARRPLNSRLAVDRIERAFGLRMPAWTEGVDAVVDELVALRAA
jgi:dTDP-4-dehydrorhamnose reductase